MSTTAIYEFYFLELKNVIQNTEEVQQISIPPKAPTQVSKLKQRFESIDNPEIKSELKPEPKPMPILELKPEPKPVSKTVPKPEPKPEHSPEPLPKPFLEPISEHKPEPITVTTPKHKPKEKIVEKTKVELPKNEQKSVHEPKEKIDPDIKLHKDASENILPKVHVDSPKSPNVTQIQKSEKSSIPVKNPQKSSKHPITEVVGTEDAKFDPKGKSISTGKPITGWL